MNLLDATKMVLLYTGYKKPIADKIATAIQEFKKDTDLAVDAPKSLRLVGKLDELAKIERISYSKEKNVANTGLDIYEFNVREENAYRLAIYSENFFKCYAVRVFTDESKFNRFKSNSKVEVLDKLNYGTSCVLKYHSGGSTVDRYAVLAPVDVTFDEDAFIVATTKAETTGYFNK